MKYQEQNKLSEVKIAVRCFPIEFLNTWSALFVMDLFINILNIFLNLVLNSNKD